MNNTNGVNDAPKHPFLNQDNVDIINDESTDPDPRVSNLRSAEAYNLSSCEPGVFNNLETDENSRLLAKVATQDVTPRTRSSENEDLELELNPDLLKTTLLDVD